MLNIYPKKLVLEEGMLFYEEHLENKIIYSGVEAWKFAGKNSKGFSPVNVPN